MQLSYSTAPVPATATIGNEQTGILSVPAYQTLLPVEIEFIEAQNLPDRRKPIADLANFITKSLNAPQANEPQRSTGEGEGFAPKAIKLVTVYNACYAWVFGTTTEAHIELIGDYFQELNALSEEISDLLEQKSYVYALALLTGRLEQKAVLADLKDPAKIHPGLVDRLATLAYIEERGTTYDEATQFPDEVKTAAPIVEVAEETDETLGK